MAKNLGREFATMDDDERRRFALEQEEGSRELPAELSFDEPRDEDKMGSHFGSPRAEVAEDAVGEESAARHVEQKQQD
jgi:hypothetical protein